MRRLRKWSSPQIKSVFGPSREAALECSPGRKPGVNWRNDVSPNGAKETLSLEKTRSFAPLDGRGVRPYVVFWRIKSSTSPIFSPSKFSLRDRP